MKMYTLTDIGSIACHGTLFISLIAAKDYAMLLQEHGLCMSFSIGCYKDGKYVEVYVYRHAGEKL